VYDLESATPDVPVASLRNPTPTDGEYFGNSVALAGSRLVVGAYGDRIAGTIAGSAYLYDLTSDTPTVPLATLNNPTPAAYDGFGYSVAICGNRVVVGSPFQNTPTSVASIYIYDLGESMAMPIATLNSPNTSVQNWFGGAVAISGSRVLVGAQFDNVAGTDNGAAYVFIPAAGFVFASWQASAFTPVELANPSVSGPGADAEADGLVNVLEYALALSPKIPDASRALLAGVQDIGGTRYLTLTFRRRPTASDLTYIPQTNGPLPGTWTANAVQVGSPVPNADGSETVTFRDSVPLGGESRFMRLQVTLAP
jgi:hypothetical protein